VSDEVRRHEAGDSDDELARLAAMNDKLLAASFDADVREETIAAAEHAAAAWALMARSEVDPAAAAAAILSTINVHLTNQIIVNLPGWDRPE
jgi:hypothetical protein